MTVVEFAGYGSALLHVFAMRALVWRGGIPGAS